MEKYFLNPDLTYTLYKMLYQIIDIFNNNGITYWASGGTFLGAVRNRGIIKWDDDLDLCVPYKFEKKVEKIFKNHPEFDYSTASLCHKIFYKKDKKEKGRNFSYPFCDIFYVHIEKDRYVCSVPSAKETWPNEYYIINDSFPLKEYNFGAYKIYGPKNYEEYFRRSYSDKWDKEGVISYDHQNERFVKKIVFQLTKSLKEPAFPFYYPGTIESFGNRDKWWSF